MPRFHLNIRENGRLVHDEEGREFDTLESARDEAIASAREIMSHRVLKGQTPNGTSIEITDANGVVVLTFPFQAALGA